MKYRCLIFDHDDTVVNSTANIHFPCFIEYLHKYHPEAPEYTLEDYFRKNFHPGVVALFRDELGMDAEEMQFEQNYWRAYAGKRTSKAFPGIREIMQHHKESGGFLVVVSHSFVENIRRDYEVNALPTPDLIFGWDDPPEQRKPDPYPIIETMRRLGVSQDEILVIDDLKPGYDMAKAAGVQFAAAGWSNDIEEIETFMRENCGLYFKAVSQLEEHLCE